MRHWKTTNKRDLEVLDKCNRRLQIEKNGQVIAVTKAEQNFKDACAS